MGLTPYRFDKARQMNINTLRAQISFSFKGETYDLELVIDLDQYPEAENTPPNFHEMLARQYKIDPYSYLFEVLESHEIRFTEPTGLAIQSCQHGQFDWAQFVTDKNAAQALRVVGKIAEQTLGIANLDEHAALKNALLAAYRAGK